MAQIGATGRWMHLTAALCPRPFPRLARLPSSSSICMKEMGKVAVQLSSEQHRIGLPSFFLLQIQFLSLLFAPEMKTLRGGKCEMMTLETAVCHCTEHFVFSRLLLC